VVIVLVLEDSMKTSTRILSVIAFSFLVTGCIGAQTGQGAGGCSQAYGIGGGILGAIGGAAGGSQFGSGTGKTAATALGTLLGAGLGYGVGSSLDNGNCARANMNQPVFAQANHQLQANPYPQQYPTYSPAPVYQQQIQQQPAQNRFTPTNEYVDPQTGLLCREFRDPMANANGVACQRTTDGVWIRTR